MLVNKKHQPTGQGLVKFKKMNQENNCIQDIVDIILLKDFNKISDLYVPIDIRLKIMHWPINDQTYKILLELDQKLTEEIIKSVEKLYSQYFTEKLDLIKFDTFEIIEENKHSYLFIHIKIKENVIIVKSLVTFLTNRFFLAGVFQKTDN